MRIQILILGFKGLSTYTWSPTYKVTSFDQREKDKTIYAHFRDEGTARQSNNVIMTALTSPCDF